MLKAIAHIIALVSLVGYCFADQPKTTEETPSGGSIAVATSKPLDQGVGRKDIRFIEMSAVVKSVDTKKREITVVGPDKKTETFDVDPVVKRLSEIKPGDKIVLQFFQSIAFELREPTAEERKAPKVVVESAAINDADLPPGLGAARAIRAIATIEEIDRGKQTVKIKGPEGRVLEVHVIEPKNLERLKLGDTVAVTYTEGLAIGINPA